MKIEAVYTGGGIILAEAELNPEQYAVVSNEAPDYLTIYKKADEPYMPEDMVLSAKHDELDPELQELHALMVEEIKAY